MPVIIDNNENGVLCSAVWSSVGCVHPFLYVHAC